MDCGKLDSLKLNRECKSGKGTVKRIIVVTPELYYQAESELIKKNMLNDSKIVIIDNIEINEKELIKELEKQNIYVEIKENNQY